MLDSTELYKKAIVGDVRKTLIKAVIDISDPDMVLPDPESSTIAPWVKPEEIHDKVMSAPARYGTLEEDRWLLDGSFKIFPVGYKVPENMGYALNELCDQNGNFSTEQWVVQPVQNVYILQFVSVYFSTDPLDGVATDFKVEVIQGGTTYYEKQVRNNTKSKVIFDLFVVYNPDEIRVTVTKWSLPYRRVRIVEIIPGFYDEWTGDQIKEFNVEQNGDFSCLTLPYGSCDITIDNLDRQFEPRTKNGLFMSIEERQAIDVYLGTLLEDGSGEYKRLGVFYQFSNGWKTGDNGITMNWSLVDIIGLLANREFIAPEVLPTTLEGWMQEFVSQLGINFTKRYKVDPNYESKSCTASADDVSGKSIGELIRYACMATGTWPRADAETGYLTVEPLWDQGNKIDLDNMSVYPVMKANTSIAALIFTLADEGKTTFVVSGNSTSSEQTISINNPFIHTQEEAITASQLILSCYGGNKMDLTSRGDPRSEIGDVDTVWLNESVAGTGRRMMQNFTFSNGVMRNCNSTLLQADGSYLFKGQAILTESGQWTAPDGVNQIRLIIGQGGQGGSRGEKGTTPTRPDDEARYGEDGLNGSGGLVWYGTVGINPNQLFEVHIGAGGDPSDVFGVLGAEGEHTTFGPYTSADGEFYEYGFTDVMSGKSYGRSAVEKPLDGSSDGGKGGKGGTPSIGWWATESTEDGGTRYYYVEEEPAGEGDPGAKGGSGFVVITWDKPEEGI